MIYIWPDYDWCWKEGIGEMSWKSDDYITVNVQDEDFDQDGELNIDFIKSALKG